MDDLMMQYMDEYLPLRDVVFKTLRQGILTGELKPGERLMEMHLAQRLGVSRTPIREAIHKLEQEGLVTMIPRRGAHVANISGKSLNDVLEVRVALESLAVELACERMSQEGLKELGQACEAFERTTQEAQPDAARIAKADVELHDVIARATGNEKLQQMISHLSEYMYRYRFEYIKDASHHARLIEEHEKLYECIRLGDKKGAVAEITEHIHNQLATIMEQLHLKQE